VANRLAADPFGRLTKRLVAQLDTLVPFLALAHREVFDVLKEKYNGWYTDSRRSTLPNTFKEYGHQVAHAAFLLGYSYAEAFVTDLIFEVYNARRDLIPAEKQLAFGDVLHHKDFDGVVRHMVEATISDMNSLEAKLLHLEKKFGWQFPETASLLDAHVARNALVHNAGHINRDPPMGSRRHSGDRVQLSAGDVHDFGINSRALAEELSNRARAICRANRRKSR
jgi:hypothetical protein